MSRRNEHSPESAWRRVSATAHSGEHHIAPQPSLHLRVADDRAARRAQRQHRTPSWSRESDIAIGPCSRAITSGDRIARRHDAEALSAHLDDSELQLRTPRRWNPSLATFAPTTLAPRARHVTCTFPSGNFYFWTKTTGETRIALTSYTHIHTRASHVSGAVVPNAMDTSAVTTPITPPPANNPLAAMYA